MSAKLNFIIFGLATLSGIALRTIMLLFTLDPNSGFFMPQYTVFTLFIIGLLCLGALTVFCSSFSLRSLKDRDIHLGGIVFPISLILVALAIIYETFFSNLPIGSGLLGSIPYGIIAVAAAGSLIYIGVCKFINVNYPGVLSLVLVVFWIFRLILVFTDFSALSLISDTVIETLLMCLSLIVFLFYSKIECGFTIKLVRIFYSVTLLCGYIASIASIPRIVVSLFRTTLVHLNLVPVITSVAIAIFTTILSAKLLLEKDK